VAVVSAAPVVQQAVVAAVNFSSDLTAQAVRPSSLARPDNKRALIIAPHTSYRTVPFMQAAQSLGIDVVIASESKHSLSTAYAEGIHIPLGNANAARAVLAAEARNNPFSCIIGTDDLTTELAALVAKDLALPFNPPEAATIARNKYLARKCLSEAGILVPEFHQIDLKQSQTSQLEGLEDVGFPCVVKPVALSASRGVIRANNQQALVAACSRVRRILDTEKVARDEYSLLIEQYIPGAEVAVEALLDNGRLTLLAIFDKPDPLDGPYFEETYYISPSRLSEPQQQRLTASIIDVCQAYGLKHGPVHAECRINDQGIWVLEVAARTIGGRCSRLFQYGVGQNLEEIILKQAIGEPVRPQSVDGGAGVLMIPITEAGILRRVEGIMAAQRIPYIEEVSIDLREGYELVPLPEGGSYLGFIFAHAPSAELAEAALRQAHACLNVVVAPLWKGTVMT
jgi:biotin carboxylase